MFATTKAVLTLGAIYFVAGVTITAGMWVGTYVTSKIEEKLEG